MIGRWLDLHGAANARVLVDGALLRSDNLQSLTQEDVTRLIDEEGVTDIVDLRTGAEVEREGPGPLIADGRVRVEHRSLYPEVVEEADLLAVWGTGGADLPDDTPTVRAYVGYLERRPDSLVGTLRDIAQAEGAVLVHCAAGKDRTGVVVMLALVLVGQDRADVIADYLRSGERIEGIVERLASSMTYREQIRVADPQTHAPREGTMDRVLELLDERFGGAETYVREHGMTEDELARLRDKLAPVRTG